MKIQKIDINTLYRPASSVQHTKKVVKTITSADFRAVDQVIEPKIRQNEWERKESMKAAAHCVVGGKK